MTATDDFERELHALVSRLKDALDELDAVSRDLSGSAAQDLIMQASKLREELQSFIDDRSAKN